MRSRSTCGRYGSFEQRPGRRKSEPRPRTDRRGIVLRFENVARSGEQQRAPRIRHQQHRLQTPQSPVGPPFLDHGHGGPRQISSVFFKPVFKPLQKRHGVRRAAGESGEDGPLVQPAHFLRAGLDDLCPERDLSVSGHGHRISAPDTDDCRSLEHSYSPSFARG
jgi:hypothetical protein